MLGHSYNLCSHSRRHVYAAAAAIVSLWIVFFLLCYDMCELFLKLRFFACVVVLMCDPASDRRAVLLRCQWYCTKQITHAPPQSTRAFSIDAKVRCVWGIVFSWFSRHTHTLAYNWVMCDCFFKMSTNSRHETTHENARTRRFNDTTNWKAPSRVRSSVTWVT